MIDYLQANSFLSQWNMGKIKLSTRNDMFSWLGVIITFCILTVALSSLNAIAADQSYTKKELQDIYMKYLAGEGYRPEVASKGYVKFKHEGKTLVILIDETDPTYIALSVYFTGEDKSSAKRLKLLEAVNYATGSTKSAKAYLDNDNDYVISVELISSSPSEGVKYIPRMISMINHAINKLSNKLKE